MAENKKSFLLYCDIIHTVEELTMEERGKLFTHILDYVNDKNPTTPDRITKIAFEPIKQALKRDLVKYEGIREKKRLAGLASAESRKHFQQMSTPVESVEQKEEVSTDSTVSVIVIDSVIDSVIEIKEKDIVDLWNTLCSPPLSKIEKITKSRKTKIALRAKEIGSIDEFKKLFEKIKKTKFLHGENDRGWKANFDWVFENDKNWLKIIEGNYDKTQTSTSTVPDWVKKAQNKHPITAHQAGTKYEKF